MGKKKQDSEMNRAQLLKGALGMQGIGITEALSEQIILTLERVDILKGEFSLRDSTAIISIIERKYAKQNKEEEEARKKLNEEKGKEIKAIAERAFEGLVKEKLSVTIDSPEKGMLGVRLLLNGKAISEDGTFVK